jgi:hypothetical protein
MCLGLLIILHAQTHVVQCDVISMCPTQQTG